MTILLAVLLGMLAYLHDTIWPSRMVRLQVPFSGSLEQVEDCISRYGAQAVPGLKPDNDYSSYRRFIIRVPGVTFLTADSETKITLRPAGSGNEMVVRSFHEISDVQDAVLRRCASTPTAIQ